MPTKSDTSQLELWDTSSANAVQTATRPDEGSPDLSAGQATQGLLFAEAEAPKPTLHVDFARSRPLNILVADDNEINRKVIRVILQKLGYQCSEADNGEQAVDHFRRKPCDYIFMDLDMPEMDGLEATLKIREEEKRPTEIIAVTANVSDETRLKCRRAGMNGYLEKPITAEIVKEQLLRSWARIRSRSKRAKRQ